MRFFHNVKYPKSNSLKWLQYGLSRCCRETLTGVGLVDTCVSCTEAVLSSDLSGTKKKQNYSYMFAFNFEIVNQSRLLGPFRQIWNKGFEHKEFCEGMWF
jgi:hypothetical protein